MRVQDSNLNSVTIGSRPAGRTDSVSVGQSGNSSVHDNFGGDRLSLSDLGSMVRSVSGDTPERMSRVSQVAAAYKSGNYRPDATAVAKSLINDSYSG